MDELRVVLALATQNNDYQLEQASAATQVAARAGVKLQVIYADNDAVNQTQQLIKVIQDGSQRPHAILVAPVGTEMPQVAKAATTAGIGWGVLNRTPEYMEELRHSTHVPVFAVTTDQEEVGTIQAKQAAILVKEGNILYIEGPSNSSAARIRSQAMVQNKPDGMELKILRGDWTEEGGERAVRSWLSLSTSRQLQIRAVVSQNDAMAIGARKALIDLTERDHEAWFNVPFLGCDGLPHTGQEWIRKGMLQATIIIPPSAGLALELLVNSVRSGSLPTALTLVHATSYPPVSELLFHSR